MSRLIRDTDLLQGLQAVRDRETGTPRMMAEWFMTMVRDTPTAYDVEAVVRELEESLEKAEHKADEYDSGTWDDIAIGLCEAIEIVKRGGRNEEHFN